MQFLKLLFYTQDKIAILECFKNNQRLAEIETVLKYFMLILFLQLEKKLK